MFLAGPLALAACAGAGGASADSVSHAGSAGAAGDATAAIDCAAEPLGPTGAFLEGARERVRHLEGVRFAGPPGGGDFPVYAITDGEGGRHRLTVENIRLPGGDGGPAGGAAAGGPYDLTVEYVMGEPAPSALVLLDQGGLVYAAASDYAPRSKDAVAGALGASAAGAASGASAANVLKTGLPGFALRLVEVGCRSRPVTKCYAARVNLALEVTHGGKTVRLGNGESRDLDGYRVTCRAAERVEYAGGCADTGVLGVSWTIERSR